jgi:hypothetical protein
MIDVSESRDMIKHDPPRERATLYRQTRLLFLAPPPSFGLHSALMTSSFDERSRASV